jgi:hypothetical protein
MRIVAMVIANLVLAMKVIILLVILLLLQLSFGKAHASSVVTTDVLAYACMSNIPGAPKKNKENKERDLMFCHAYITGWDDARFAFLQGKVTYCPPSGLTSKELSIVFFDYVATHPEAKKMPVATVLMMAARDKWPCKDTSQ